MKTFVRENGLTLVMTALFLLALAGQIVAGWTVYNDQQEQLGASQVSIGQYVTTGHFGEAVFEHWESEFLQMGLFVLLTVWLRQKDPDAAWPSDWVPRTVSGWCRRRDREREGRSEGRPSLIVRGRS